MLLPCVSTLSELARLWLMSRGHEGLTTVGLGVTATTNTNKSVSITKCFILNKKLSQENKGTASKKRKQKCYIPPCITPNNASPSKIHGVKPFLA